MSRWQSLVARIPQQISRQLLRRGGAALLAGALGFLLLGTTPTRVAADGSARAAWSVPTLEDAPSDASRTAWQRPIWASQPATAADPVVTAAQPTLLGIVNEGGVRVALFLMPDGQRIRAMVGESLPNGGRVISLSATRAAWRDADGQPHETRLLDARSP